MNKKRFIFLWPAVITPLLLACAFTSGRAQEARQVSPAPYTQFRNFTGMCQGWGSFQLADTVGWDREDIGWDRLEPSQGKWNDAEMEKWGKRVLDLKSRGIEFLPVLCYNTPWAIDALPRIVSESEEARIVLQKNEAGEYIRSHYVKAHNGSWVRESVSKVKPNNRWAIAADQVPAWENYVRRVVRFLSASPYNLKYFQIWNEAHPASGFWQLGTMDDYMVRIHLPAAKIIHEAGGKVVYGGWPDKGPVPEYIAMLDRHKAWGTIDVHDLHYASIWACATIRQAARERGYASVPVWQTEIGFVRNTGTIPNIWPRFLAWGLRNDWSEPDKYKLFWFPAGTPNSPESYGYGYALLHGNSLAAHGQALQAISKVFAAGQVGLYEGKISSNPPLKSEEDYKTSSLEVFRVGKKKIVVAVHLSREKSDTEFAQWTGPSKKEGALKIPLFDLRIEGVRAADTVGIYKTNMGGERITLKPANALDAQGITLQVPILDSASSPARETFKSVEMHTFFIELELK